MLSRLFPSTFDNAGYRGYTLGLWLLVPLLGVKLLMGINTILNTRSVIEGADGIALGKFSDEAATLVVYEFRAWGLALILFALLGVIALVRYRSMVPLAYLMLFLENAGRKVIGLMTFPPPPPSQAGLSLGAEINAALIAVALIGLLLAIGPKDSSADEA